MSASVETVTPAPTTPATIADIAATLVQPAASADELRQMRTQLDAMRVQYERRDAERDAEMTRLRTEHLTAQNERVLAQYERDLTPLLNEYDFSLPDIMADCKDPTGAPIARKQFDGMVEKIKKYFRPTPIERRDSPLGTVGGHQIISDGKLVPAKTDDPRSQIGAADIMPLAMYTRAQQDKDPNRTEDDCIRDYVKAKAERAASVKA